jgi:hypothetical protein
MLMGGSDPARGVAAARTEQDHVGQLRDPLDCGSAARAADRELYAMFCGCTSCPGRLDRIAPGSCCTMWPACSLLTDSLIWVMALVIS